MSESKVSEAGQHAPQLTRAILGVFIGVAAAALSSFGFVVVPHERAEAVEQWRGRLSAMADDRRAAIERWLTAALADAQAASTFPIAVSVASHPAGEAAPAERAHLASILASISNAEGFDGGWALDAGGGVLVAVRDRDVPFPPLGEGPAGHIARGEPTAELQRSRDGKVWAFFAAPIRASATGAVVGTIVFRNDPERFLFPLIRSEPIPTATGETLLVTADGADFLFLGPLRHRDAAPLTFRIPRATVGLAATPASEGRNEFGEFRDYRGKPVYAATRGIPHTDWGLVIEVDRDEALASYHHAVRDQLGMLGALALGLGGIAYGIARSRRASYESRIAASQTRLGVLLDRANDPILFVGPDLRIRRANHRAEEFYGYGPRELIGVHVIDDLRPPEDRALAREQLEEYERAGQGVFRASHVRSDGRTVAVEVSVSRADAEGEDERVAIIRDLSERQAAERRIHALVRTLKMSTAIHELIARARDRLGLLAGACEIAVSSGGFRMAWVGLAEGESGTLVPAASFGEVAGYFDDLAVRADLTPLGRGPVAAALGERRTVVVNDTASDTAYSSRAAALARGYAASAVTPIRADDSIVGVLGLHVGTTEYFDEEMIGVVEELADALGFALRSIEARDSLAESEQRFRRLAENLPDVIYRRRLLPAPAYEYVSPSVSRLVGFSPVEFYSDPFLLEKLVSPADFARLTDPRAVGWGSPALIPLRHRDGRTVLVEYRRQPVYGPGGELVAVEGIARDVTEQHRSLEELRRTTATLSALVEASPLAILTANADGTVGIWNPAAERLLGWPAAEVRGNLLPIASPENRAQLEVVRDRVLAGETFAGLELIGRHRKDGSVVDLSLSAAPIQGPDGATVILCIAEDITARRAGEVELRKLSRAVEQSPVSIVITDAAGNIEYVNPRFARVTGYGRDEVLGKNPRILKSGEGSPELYRTLWQTITSGNEWRGELHNRKKSGELFWEDVSISPITDDRGRTTHFLAVKEDITARKTLEAKLEQSQKMEAIGRLAGGVAHDFNNLLTVISGYTSLLLRDAAKDSKPGMALAEIEAASKRAAALTQQLLAFGRRQVFQPRPVSLAAVVGELEKMLRSLIGEDVVLSTSSAPDLGTVVADPNQIEQILLNLAVNARDAMPGGGRIDIVTANASVGKEAARGMPGLAPGEYVLLSVSDTGEGMAPEVLPHVFEPFFTTKEKGKGTGLGLATVYGIVKQSGGGIYVDTAVGKGATFRIYLPRGAEAASAAMAPVDGSAPRGTEKIVLVEDEDGVREIVRRLLEHFGYSVVPLPGPLEAIAYMADPVAGDVALVITDIVMPHMDGRTLSLRLREARPELKVLFMTGYMPDETLRAGIVNDGTALLQKPFRPEQLAHKVREVLDAIPTG